MIFGIFSKAKLPPLTAYCTKLSVPANLFNIAESITTDPSPGIDKRARVLSLVIMAAAGHFVGRLRWGALKGKWEGSRRYLRDTNLDVITAEAIIWVHFLMAGLRRADQKEDHDLYERVGEVTFSTASQLALAMIKKQTGFDFKARAIESRSLYYAAMKDKDVGRLPSDLPSDPFTITVLRSIGCRSLAEPLKSPSLELLPPPEWTPLAIKVSIFYSTMPEGFYKTFKEFLSVWSDRFPHDEDFDDC
jgi:hypothetical protein